MIKSILVAGSLFSAMPAGSGAGPSPSPAFQIAWNAASLDGDDWKTDALKALDLDIGGTASESTRSVAITTDRGALLAELPLLQEHGALSKSITGDDVAQRPASYVNALSLLLTSYAVRDLYSTHPGLGPTRWKVSAAPESGQAPRELFSFSFDRPLFERLPWERLAFQDFARAAPGFSYNLRFTLEMSREIDGSIADD